MWESDNNHQMANKIWEGHVANLIFNQMPTEFIIIRNATKQLQHLEAEDVDRLIFLCAESQEASCCLKIDISLEIQRAGPGLIPSGWRRQRIRINQRFSGHFQTWSIVK